VVTSPLFKTINMKSTKVINNISDKLKSEIPRLKQGEVAVFEFITGLPNPDPDERERSKYPVIYGKRQLRTNFRIFDPYLGEYKDDKGETQYHGGYVDVGLVEQWNGDHPLRFRSFIPGQGEYSRFHGKFQLNGGNIADEELFEILWLSPEREDNQYRDKSEDAIYRLVNTKTDSKAAVTKVDRLLKAINLAKSMDESEGNAVLASLNQASYQDKDVLKAKLLQFAKDNVEEFLAAAENPNRKTNLIVRRAIEAGIITHDVATGDVKNGKVTLTTIRVQTLGEFVPKFVQWINSAANGQDVLSNISAQVEKPKAQA
jgi:hypothetical protein